MLYENLRSDIYDIKEAYLKGNSFASLYTPYKNYQIKPLEIKSEKEALLTDIMMLDFAINDLHLYLLNNNDNEAKHLIKEYKELYDKNLSYYNNHFCKEDKYV